MSREIRKDENYMGRVLKMIPIEIVALYLVIQGIIPGGNKKWGLLIVSLVLFIITPFYLRVVHEVKRVPQLVIYSLTFIVWVYALGGPFVYFNIHEPWLSSLVLLLWTIFVPRFFGTKLI